MSSLTIHVFSCKRRHVFCHNCSSGRSVATEYTALVMQIQEHTYLMSTLARESVATEYTTFVMRNTSYTEHVFVLQYNLECRLWSDTRAGSTKNSLRNTCHAGTCTRPGNILSGIISSKLRCDVDTIIMVLCKCHLWMQAQLISGTTSKTRPVRQLYSGKS